MKRKFSINLAPVKIPSKSDAPAKPAGAPQPTLTHSHSHSHRRHHSKDSVTTLNSPYINRRPLAPKTEHELRAACALILQNFKPSDHGITDVDPKLDFQGMNKRREHREYKSGNAEVRVRQPTGAPPDFKSIHDAGKRVHRADVAAREQQPTRANTGRRRTDQSEAIDKGKQPVRSPITEQARSAMMRAEQDSDDGKSLGTPLTGSTDVHHNNGSTAPTSAALTSGRSSKRASRQFDSAAALADHHAAEWMHQELAKRRREQATQSQPEVKSPTQAPSRSKSIRSGIRDYIFPGSVTMSRTQSHESLSTLNSSMSPQKEPRRSGSSHGWRSWGLQRKSSSRSNSRPGTSKGRIETQDSDKKVEIDLNRELPPLPSLDSWKEQEHPSRSQENRKSRAQGAHIATVMRSPDQQQQEYAAAVRRHHRRSGSDTLALRYANSSFAHSSPQVARTKSHKNQPAREIAPSPRVADVTHDFDDLMSAMKSTEDFDDQLRLGANGNTHQCDKSSLSRSPSIKLSTDNTRLEAPPNFSRKISSEVSSSQRTHDHCAYINQVQIAPHTERQFENKSKLKKVFSGWMLRKEKKENWMDKFEKNGIKNGVMIQDEAALPPVVRY